MRNLRQMWSMTIAVFVMVCLTTSPEGVSKMNALTPQVVIPPSLIYTEPDLPVKAEERIQKIFALNLSDGKRLLEVDNVVGSIEVTGSSTDKVQMEVKKTIRAQSQETLERGKREVTLDVTEGEGLLKLYMNGPFRNGCSGNCWHPGAKEGYSVKMDIQLRVPHDIELKLKTVNGGYVQVKDVSGHFSVANVNGSVVMEDIAGSGHVASVNGGVKVVFRENPQKDSEFSTLNGDVELHFVKGLSAKFRFDTMNGGVFSDLPTLLLTTQDGEGAARRGPMSHPNLSTGHVGSGGPEIKAGSLNGNIRILERQ